MNTRTPPRPRRILVTVLRAGVLCLLCFGAWLYLTQDITRGSMIAGAVLAVLATVFSFPVFFGPRTYPSARLFVRLDLLIVYVVIVFVQSYLSTFDLIYRMIRGSYSPGVIRLKTRLRSKIGRTVLANTLTLVPGTLSFWIEQSHIYVHWFNVQTTHTGKARRLLTYRLEAILLRVFG